MAIKIIRVARVGGSFLPEGPTITLVTSFYEPDSRDEKIAQDRKISNVV
jgi:hypothetical protein